MTPEERIADLEDQLIAAQSRNRQLALSIASATVMLITDGHQSHPEEALDSMVRTALLTGARERAYAEALRRQARVAVELWDRDEGDSRIGKRLFALSGQTGIIPELDTADAARHIPHEARVRPYVSPDICWIIVDDEWNELGFGRFDNDALARKFAQLDSRYHAIPVRYVEVIG